MPGEREHNPGQINASLISAIIERVWDPVELKAAITVVLHGGSAEPVWEQDILADSALLKGARGDGSDRDPRQRIGEALASAVARGILMALRDEDGRTWYMVASNEARQLIGSGEFTAHDPKDDQPASLRIDRPNVFGLYEQNIGVVTPIMADRLSEALEIYPEEWIREAIGEAVTYNKRNWRYIQRILENWTTEGKADETNRRDHEEHLDSEKYLRGKYAALFRRR